MAGEGFVIGDRTYPFVTVFRLCDPVLVSQLTNMTWHEFVELLDDDEADPAAMAGMIGVAVWQGNPRWTRERVVRYIEQLDMDSVDVIAPDDEADADPPPEAAVPSPPSPEESTRESESILEPIETAASTGQPLSDTSSQGSLRVA